MKVHIEIDCTPEEARTFMGLPDVGKVNDVYVDAVAKAMKGVGSIDKLQEYATQVAPMGQMGLTNGLWSPLRAFARSTPDYYALLDAADQARAGDLDGSHVDHRSFCRHGLRGDGEAPNPDTGYGSITAAPPEQETIVSLQEKLAYMLKLLQQADARPTTQAITSVDALLARLDELKMRVAALNPS